METITDLHGNTYKLGDFQLSLEFPKLSNYEIRAFTKNAKDGTSMNIISDGKHTFMVKYLMYCKDKYFRKKDVFGRLTCITN